MDLRDGHYLESETRSSGLKPWWARAAEKEARTKLRTFIFNLADFLVMSVIVGVGFMALAAMGFILGASAVFLWKYWPAS